MLRTLDILIGFVGIMLIMSMAVAFVTLVVATAVNFRGRQLRHGIAQLLREVFPEVDPKWTFRVATAVLSHPMLATGRRRLGTSIECDELVRVLLELAGEKRASAGLNPDVTGELRRALANRGIADPERTLRQIEAFAVDLEAHELSAPPLQLRSAAVVRGAPSQFVAGVYAWFDAAMARARERDVLQTRLTTLAVAAGLALLLQIDSVRLINRLSVDGPLRQALVAAAATQLQRPPSDPPEFIDTPERQRRRLLQTLENDALAGVLVVPARRGEWMEQLRRANLPGLALSAVFLAIGASFWFRAQESGLRLGRAQARTEQPQEEHGESVSAG